MEQLHAQVRFDLAQLLTDRAGGYAELLGSRSDAATPRDGFESLDGPHGRERIHRCTNFGQSVVSCTKSAGKRRVSVELR